tara:strand:- start:214 stop:585 length:372 start_codon:yes stop_codon:yes gene_type:complete
MSKISKDDLFELRVHQLKEVVKQIKNKLNLNVTGENKQKLVNSIYTLHNGNKFDGKKLLSFDKSGHIQLPEGKNRELKAKPKKFKSSKQQLKGTSRATLKKGELEDVLKKDKKAVKNPTYGLL